MSLSRVRRQVVRIVATAAVLVAACAPAVTTPAAAPPSAPGAASSGNVAPAASLATVRVAVPGAIFEPIYPRAAKDAGLYAEDGLDVEFVEAPSDTIVTSGVISGEFHVGRVGAQSVLTAASQGSDLVMVAAPHTALPFIFAAQEGFTSLEGLYDQPVGEGAPGSFLANVTGALYRARGLDPERLVAVNTGTATQSVAALIAGKVAASLVLYTDMAVLSRSGARTVQLADVREELPSYLRTVLVIRRKSLVEDDALMRRFFVAHSRAYRWAIANEEAVVQTAMKYQNRERADAEANFELLLRPKLMTPDFAFTEEQMDYMQRLNLAVGSQRDLLPFDRVADLRYVKAIAEALGPYVPPAR
jgi:NitT/TauT family transport system substrate-binding protein